MRPLAPHWLSGINGGGINAYSARIVGLALLAAAYPLAGLYSYDRRAFILALGASLTVLILLVRRLSPLVQTAMRLRDSIDLAETPEKEDEGSGGRLLADAEEVTSRLA